jgi:tetratricopeptide (TPR) repeat protein
VVVPLLVQKLPLAALAAGFAMIAARAQQAASDETVRTLASWGVRERVMQACYGLIFYPWKTIAPTRLSALYELPASIGLLEARFVAGVVCVVIVLASVALLAARRPRIGVPLGAAMLAYAAILSPVLGLFQSGIQLVADRYAYLALMPLMVLVGAGAAILRTRRPRAGGTILAGAAALAAVLATLSFAQSTLWGDTRALWEHAIASTTPGPVMLNYHARQLEKARELPGAEAQYRASLALNPAYGDSWLGLGHTLRAQGRLDEAIEAYKRATATMLDPTNAHVALGMIRVSNQQRPDLAIAHFAEAARVLESRGNRANSGAVFLLLAAAYGESGNEREAITWLERARRYPDTRPQAEQYLRDLGVLR